MFEAIYEFWDAKLARAQTIGTDLILPTAAAATLAHLCRSVIEAAEAGESPPERFAEWLDILPRNALRLTDVQSCVTVRPPEADVEIEHRNAVQQDPWGIADQAQGQREAPVAA